MLLVMNQNKAKNRRKITRIRVKVVMLIQLQNWMMKLLMSLPLGKENHPNSSLWRLIMSSKQTLPTQAISR